MIKGFVIALAASVALAGCSTLPQPQRVGVTAAAPVAQPVPYRWTQGNAPQAYQDALAAFGPLRLKPGQYRWAAAIPETGEARIVIDLLTQLFYVYRGDQLVGVATISSGKKGKETPLGFWAVFRKQKLGYSRKYDNAPMPFMQMYDEKGIAFHGGPNPGYPASHGCVRLPVKFAERLFGLTTMGTKVIIEG
ncbi:MAG TPA: L,D-transpeptidase family protein [Sphingomicrobium sp.]|nr:L,D-transpeptidase family protein [Sphingomicrobium sp.]